MLFRFAQAAADLPASPAVLIPEEMPFFTTDSMEPIEPLNRWLLSLPLERCNSAATWISYARDLQDWLRFLEGLRVDLLADPGRLADGVAAYHAYRLIDGPLSAEVHGRVKQVRLAKSSWNHAVTSIFSFYSWAVDEGLLSKNPLSTRQLTIYTGNGVRQVERINAKEKAGRREANIKPLGDDFIAMFMDVGLGGMLPDGLPDRAFRGRMTGRNTALAGLMVDGGLRRSEAAWLTPWELPAAEIGDADFYFLSLPPGICKGHKARTTGVLPRSIARVHSYIDFERAAAVRPGNGHPPEPLYITEANPIGARINGRFHRWTSLGKKERARLVAPDGGPVTIFLSDEGTPLVEIDKIFRRAVARCRKFQPRFPDVHPTRCGTRSRSKRSHASAGSASSATNPSSRP